MQCITYLEVRLYKRKSKTDITEVCFCLLTVIQKRITRGDTKRKRRNNLQTRHVHALFTYLERKDCLHAEITKEAIVDDVTEKLKAVSEARDGLQRCLNENEAHCAVIMKYYRKRMELQFLNIFLKFICSK